MIDKKIIVITGASSGLGEALSSHFGVKGFLVCALSRSKIDLKVLTGKNPDNIYNYAVDVSKPEAVELTFNKIVEDHGRIDVLINNAGVIHGPGEIGNQSIQSIDRVIDTNLKGTMYCSYCAISSMLKNGGGKIINIASSAGLPGYGGHIKKTAPVGDVFFGDYGVSKWGVVGFGEAMTEPLRQHNISMTTLCPGAMATGNCADRVEGSMKTGELIELKNVVNLIEFVLNQPNAEVRFNSIEITPPLG